MIGTLLLILLFLALSALFSGTEIAFVSANKLLVELKRKRSPRRGELLARFFERPADFLGAMLVGNNLAMVALTALAGALLTPWVSPFVGGEFGVLLLNSVIITAVVLVFGEFLPKALFEVFAERILFALAYPINALRWLLSPLAWLMIRLSERVLALVTRQPIDVPETAFTRLDLEQYIIQTHADKGDDAEESIDPDLFQNALNFNDLRVREVMVPRNEVVGIDVSEPVGRLAELFAESRHSRLIVYEDDVDNVLGYVHHQQLLESPRSIRAIVLDLAFVPEAMRLSDLMKRFIAARKSIAAVVDEYGTLTGLVALEDVVEEIFGEIVDEHDDEELVAEQLSDTTYLLSGRLEVDHLNDVYPELDLPDGDYTTLSGYLVTTTGSIPEQGDVVEDRGRRFVLEDVSETKIELVRIEVLGDGADEP